MGTTDGMVCGILGAEPGDAQGADPRNCDFLECFFPAREAAPRTSAASAASRNRNRELQALKTYEKHFFVEVFTSSQDGRKCTVAGDRVGIHHLM